MARWSLEVASRFEAAHWLRSYRGAAEPVHGHSWRVVARLETSGLDEDGLAFDFVEIKRALDDLAGRLDHGEINRVPPFDVESPSTERVAAWFFDELSGIETVQVLGYAGRAIQLAAELVGYLD